MTTQEILTFLKTHKSEFFQKYHVSKIGLFGSYADNTYRSDSDIDILVTMPSNFDNFYALKEELEESLKTPVDLGLESSLRVLVKEQIKESILYA